MEKIAIIPARGNSKRLPNKNMVEFLGAPMITYPIISALKSNLFDDIIVSTEDEKVEYIADNVGAHVIKRPKHLSDDKTHELSAVKHVLRMIENNPVWICIIYPTAVMIESNDLINSYQLIENASDIEAVMCVTEYQIHPFKALFENDSGYLAMAFPEECKKRSQDYSKAYASNGTFYWLRTEKLDNNLTYYQNRLKAYKVPYYKGIDIDNHEDLKWAEFIAKNINSKDIL